MRCEKIMRKFNDLLDRSLSAKEEHEIQAHLAVCPNCRAEFQLTKNADDILRATVIEMVTEIEVPANLSQRIGQALAGEKKRQTGKTRLFGLFRPPALAAAMLMLVAAVGLFGYYKLFDPSLKNPAVVMSVPESQSASENADKIEPSPLSGAGREESAGKDATAAEAQPKTRSPLVTEKAPAAEDTTTVMQDADNLNAEAAARKDAPPRQEGGESFSMKENGAADLTQAPDREENGAADLAPAPDLEEQIIPMASSQSSGAAKLFMSSRAALPQGTLQEAIREVGFTPAVPGYLPPETELKDVTWETGTVCLGYLVADQKSFTLSQSQAAEAGAIGEEGGQLIDLNGVKARLQETSSGGDPARVYTSVRWQRGEWVFTVKGDLPRKEILKIALSIE